MIADILYAFLFLYLCEHDNMFLSLITCISQQIIIMN